jgi:hypothetical protein
MRKIVFARLIAAAVIIIGLAVSACAVCGGLMGQR